MLSAVENPYGPGRPYAHHFAGQTISPSTLLSPCPISSLPLNTAAAVAAAAAASMSVAKFVRPHPKTRYNRSSLRNGLTTSPRSKYLEQTDPVNLAVSQSPSSLSLSGSGGINSVDTNIIASQSQTIPDNDVALNSTISSIYSGHKLSPYVSSQPGATVDPYQTLNYSTLYGRTPTIYGAQPIYQPHLLTPTNRTPSLHHSHANSHHHHHHPHHHRPTYIPSQLDPYSTYLPAVSILPPAPIPSTQLSPSTGVNVGGIGNSGSILSHTKSSSVVINSNTERSPSDIPVVVTHRTQSPKASSLAGHNKILDGKSLSIYKRTSPLNNNGTGANISNGKSTGFKVPSGKEGSLKHRILTRPYSERDCNKTKSSIQGLIVRSSNNNNAPTNFTKGSLIELANGELRAVEEMRTEDFILSSSKNPDLQLADTTVVNIVNGHQNNVIITFNYNNSKIEMEALPEHPFFVYGQGWASCHPEGSMQVFGLKCNRLQIGDTCISLTPRIDALSVSTPSASSSLPSSILTPTAIGLTAADTITGCATQQLYYNPYNSYSSNCSNNSSNIISGKEDNNNTTATMQLPQNLSRKQLLHTATMSTNATSTTLVNRTPSHVHPSLATYTTFMNNSNNSSNSNNSNSSINQCHRQDIGHSILALSASTASATLSASAPIISIPPVTSHSRPLSQDGLTRTIPLHIIASTATATVSASATKSTTGSPLTMNRPSLNHHHSTITSGTFPSTSTLCSSTDIVVDDDGDDDDSMIVVDATLSKKRRWSAPDNICDDESCQQAGQKICNH